MRGTFRSRRWYVWLAVVVSCAALVSILPSVATAQGFALRFDGGDFVRFGTVPAQFSNTLEAWIRPTGNLSNQLIVGQLSGPSSPCGEGISLEIANGNKLDYDLDPAGCGNSGSNSVIGPAPVPGVWTHLAGTYDGTTARFYVNGELVGQKPVTTFGTSSFLAAGAFFLSDGVHPSYTGDLAEIRLWSRARTAQEIRATLSCPLAGTEPGLVGYWRLNEGTGQVVRDSSSGGRHGVLGNSASVESSDPSWVSPGPPVSASSASCLVPPDTTITSATGGVEATLQGATVPITAMALVGHGVQITTSGNGQVQGSCDNGTRFSLNPDSRLFFGDSLCRPIGVGMLDVTRGTFGLVSSGSAASADAPRAQSSVAGVRTPVSTAVIVSAGAVFNTTYTQVGNIGTAVTTVQSGNVAITKLQTGEVSMVAAGQVIVQAPVPGLVAAVLPSSRSVQVGRPATGFASIINVKTGLAPTIVCQISPVTSVPATFNYQTTNASNLAIGAQNTPTSIPAGASQSFVYALTPTAPFASTDVQLKFECGGTQAPVVVGLNTLLLSASLTPVPDIVALAATLNNDGVVRLLGSPSVGAFAVATVNVGVTGTITASADTGGASLPLALSLCQTNAAGACLGAPASGVTTTITGNATPTFGIFVTGLGNVPFDPARNRIFVRFKDAGGIVRGATSVAVQTP